MSDDDADVPETVSTYLRLRGLEPRMRGRRRRRVRDAGDENQPFAAGRDPHGVGDVLAGLVRESGWQAPLERADIVGRWDEVAGEDNARHTTPVGLSHGVLTVKCDSTAWMVVLRNMRAQILTTIVTRYPDAGVDDIRFLGPDVPSWKYGPRVVPGRGPRDTYG